MAEITPDTVYNEERVRGNIIPLDAANLGERQRTRQQVDRGELAESVFEAMFEEVDQWPEVEELERKIAELQARKRRLSERRARRNA